MSAEPHLPEDPDPVGTAAVDLAWTIIEELLAALAITLLAFLLLGGRFQDLYMLPRHHAPLSDQVAVVTLDPESMYL